MRPESNPTRSLAGFGDLGREAAQEVSQEPVSEHEPGRNVKQKYRRKPDQHSRPRIQNEVRSHHSRNRAACAHTGYGGGLMKKDGGSAGRHSADQVEHEILEMSDVIFDVVAEDPQEEHV